MITESGEAPWAKPQDGSNFMSCEATNRAASGQSRRERQEGDWMLYEAPLQKRSLNRLRQPKCAVKDRFTFNTLNRGLLPSAAPPCGVSGAVHPAPSHPVPPVRPDAGAAAPPHALQTLLRTEPALQAALRAGLHTAGGESPQQMYPSATCLVERKHSDKMKQAIC